MCLKIFQVDAFTDKPFKGNPAAICILNEPRSKEWMINLASEMNLSETAFLIKNEDGYNIKWFTPEVEVNLCGHATLASAHILWEEGQLEKTQEAIFYSKSGILRARNQGWIELDFPSRFLEIASAPKEVIEALRINPIFIGKYNEDYLIEVESEDIIRNLDPDFTKLKCAPVRAVIVTSKASSEGLDFVSRFFAPSGGVNEDPVTGSAHCCLGPYWGNKLKKNELFAYQASKRGGEIKVKLVGDRVLLCGKAVTIFKGELKVK